MLASDKAIQFNNISNHTRGRILETAMGVTDFCDQ